MRKTFRFRCSFTTGAETVDGYHLVFAESERTARAKFHETHNARTNLPGSPTIQILAVDEIDDATITESLEGADLSTIPALQRLPRKALVIQPADSPGCESGWARRVMRDAEGHNLHDNLKVVGCRSYMESPPEGGPWYLVSSSDGKLSVVLCQEHFAENFPGATALMKASCPASGATKGEANGEKAGDDGRRVGKDERRDGNSSRKTQSRMTA